MGGVVKKGHPRGGGRWSSCGPVRAEFVEDDVLGAEQAVVTVKEQEPRAGVVEAKEGTGGGHGGHLAGAGGLVEEDVGGAPPHPQMTNVGLLVGPQLLGGYVASKRMREQVV